jgi:hypothetical protein
MSLFSFYFFFESLIYLFQIFDLNTINLLRDISVVFSTTTSVLLFLSALVVQYGATVVENKLYMAIAIIATIGILVIGLPLDEATIDISTTPSYVLFESVGIGKIVLVVFPGIFVLYALFQYLRVRYTSDDQDLRMKLLKLTIGLGSILLGIAYLAVFQTFRYPAHVMFLVGLSFMVWAFK